MRPVRWSRFALGAFALVMAGSVAQAGELTKEGAEEAIAACLQGNGSPKVTEVREDGNDMVADVAVTDYKHQAEDGSIKTVSGTGTAHFMSYSEGPWTLRHFTAPDGSGRGCHVDVKPPS